MLSTHQHVALQMPGRAQGEQPAEGISHRHHRRRVGNEGTACGTATLKGPCSPQGLRIRGGSAALGRLLECPHSAPPSCPSRPSLSTRHRPAPQPPSLGAAPHLPRSFQQTRWRPEAAAVGTSNASPTSRRLPRAAPAANQRASLSEIAALGPEGSAPRSSGRRREP